MQKAKPENQHDLSLQSSLSSCPSGSGSHPSRQPHLEAGVLCFILDSLGDWPPKHGLLAHVTFL